MSAQRARPRGIGRRALLAVALATLARAAHAGPADSTATAPAPGAEIAAAPGDKFTRRDLVFAGVAGAALAGAFAGDRRLEANLAAENSSAARAAARAAEHFGNPAVVAPALVAVDLAGRFTGRPDLAASAERIGLSVAVAGVAALALKEVVGRARPIQRPGDPDDTRAFSGWASFPSGHTTVAFAWAAALDAETRARWVPWVAYPVAAAVGWSRVRDREHWPSDVVAGAALGGWLARHADARLRRVWRHPLRLGLVPDGRRARLGASVRF